MKAQSFSTILIVLLLQFNSSAQIIPGAKQIALSHSSIALAHDVFTHFSNPAGLAQLNWREIGFYYSPSPFGLKELANAYAAYHEPTKFGSFTIGVMTYGFDLYRENNFSFSYSNRIYKKFFVAVKIKYYSLSIKNYGNTNALAFSLSGLFYLDNNLRAAFSADNISRATYKNYEDQIPTTLIAGFSYDMLNNLILNLAYSQEIDFKASIHAGIDYQPVKYINLRFGFATEPSSFSGGIGINYSLFELDYALFNHQDLGLTHQAGLIIHFTAFDSRLKKIRDYLKIN